jgi:hypothetical protein
MCTKQTQLVTQVPSIGPSLVSFQSRHFSSLYDEKSRNFDRKRDRAPAKELLARGHLERETKQLS